MRTSLLLAALITSTLLSSPHPAQARGGLPGPPLPPPVFLPPGPPAPPGVHVNINGYLPPPPGVHIHEDGGRPYYIERERRIYLKKGHSKKHLKKNHGHGHGKKSGHYKH